MSSPLNDPRFPDRPNTPDFWRLSEVILKLDGDATEAHVKTEDALAAVVDPESAIYMASQRAGRVLDMGVPERFKPLIMAQFLNAFLAGAHFERLGGHRPTDGNTRITER